MKIIHINLIAALAALSLASCSNDDGAYFIGSGQIAPALSIDRNILSVSLPESEENDSQSADLSPDDFAVTLTSVDGSYSKTWSKFGDFPVDDVFKVGTYEIEAYHGALEKEGFESPYYSGSQRFSVKEAETATVEITCKLSNSIVTVDCSEAFRGYFSDFSTTFHSEGGGYFTYSSSETRNLYMMPGDISLSVTVTNPNGQEATFALPTVINALPQHHYRVHLDVNQGEMGAASLVLSFDDSTDIEDVVIDLSDDIMSVPSPEIFTQGFSPGEPISMVEGVMPSEPVTATLSAQGGLKSVKLSCRNNVLQQAGLPSELDLMKATADQQSVLTDLGLDVKGLWRNPDKMAEIDFSRLLTNVLPDNGDESVIFSLMVIDKYGKASQPTSLIVNYSEVALEVNVSSPIVLGQLSGSVDVSAVDTELDPQLLSLSVKTDDGWMPSPVTGITSLSEREWRLSFNAPDGNKPLSVRVMYNSRLKYELVVPRVVPEYSIVVDPYACSAVVKVEHSDPSVVAAITRYAELATADGRKVRVVKRQPSEGLITLAGLDPSTTYQIKAVALSGDNSQFVPSARFETETKASVPNGDFEEAELSKEYDNIPSGGRYSQTHVGIYNHQNHWSGQLYLPEGSWATVNDKTMCEAAKHKNTWYQQLSAMIVSDSKSGSKAMKLTSVAWDPAGEPIKDYAQNPGEYLSYNPNVPNISYRATGKLFLGRYSYSPVNNKETYIEGVAFSSRPSALTGYYKYLPASHLPLDNGIAKVELLNISGDKETVVASASASLTLSPDYTSFSVPLEYSEFGLKPNTLRIMFASSSTIGTIEQETSSVITVDDLEDAASRGSSLWVDNLSFAY